MKDETAKTAPAAENIKPFDAVKETRGPEGCSIHNVQAVRPMQPIEVYRSPREKLAQELDSLIKRSEGYVASMAALKDRLHYYEVDNATVLAEIKLVRYQLANS